MELRLFLVVFVLCVDNSSAAPPKAAPKSKTIFLDKPTGYCNPVCSCYVYGVYYSEGERWVNPEDPCTVFECFRHGIFEPISQGCLYKGECKAIESTWQDGCNTYICVEEGFIHYKLAEAGCRRDGGQCMVVGEKLHQGCDVLECQIEGAQLTINKVRTGCSVEGSCESVGSYWHDGCSVYTCAEEADRTVKKTLSTEVMFWPDASFAMMKAETGCPIDEPGKWAEGYRKHYGEGQNYFSVPFSLAGEHTLEYIAHQFCVHQYQPGGATTPRFTTFWEPGSYCILRSGGRCPRGFNDGFLLFDDNNKKTKLAQASGTLPDGDFTTDTGLFFCCRGDGHVLDEIVLPKDKSFVMFMNQHETQCQKVKGLSNSIEYFSFDGSPSSALIQNGSLPEVKYDNGDVALYLCIYKPLTCGCVDDDGQFVAVGEERTLNCVTKKCVSDRGVGILQVVLGGCSVNGLCEIENAEWSLNRGESCTKQTCKKVLLNGTETYEVINTADGCSDGDVCRDVGYERYNGCYTSVCTLDQNVLQPVFKVKKADCPWQDSCKPVNSTWTHSCMTYRCNMNIQGGHYQWKIQPIEYGCNDGGKCYKVGDVIQGRCYKAECKLNSNKTVVFLDIVKGGCTWKDECKKVNETWKDGCHQFECVWTNADTGFTAVVNATNVSCEWNNTCYQDQELWTDGCVDYKCVIRRQEAEVKWGVETVRLGCRGFHNNCVAVGENVTEACITYQCNHQGDRIGLDAIVLGCEWNNTCKLENAMWTDDKQCADYQCLKTTHKNGTVMHVKMVNYACVFNNTCMPVNATWSDGCRTRQCIVRKRGKLLQRDTAAISAGCDDEGICRPVGHKKITPTCMTYECRFNEELKDSFYTLSGGACRSRGGKCFDKGKTWEEKEPGICVKYKCVKSRNGPNRKMIEQSCRDVNGVCKPIGSTGFSAEVQGQLRADCACTQAQTKGIGVNISCAK